MPAIKAGDDPMDDLPATVAQFEEDVARVEVWVNGDELAEYTTEDGIAVPSISKVIASVDAMIAPDVDTIMRGATAAAASAAAAKTSETNAAASAASAGTAAGSASDSASSADGNAIIASDAATRAEAAESAAGAARDAAVGASDAVEQSADRASTAATNAGASQSAAAASESAAKSSETSAGASAAAASSSQGSASASQIAAGASQGAAHTSELNAAASAAQAAQAALAYPFRNLLHNARFLVNQRWCGFPFTPTVDIAYCVDRWRVFVKGQTVSLRGIAGSYGTIYYEMTCPAGGLDHVVEPSDIMGGTYVFSWQGTATLKVTLQSGVYDVLKGGTLAIPLGEGMRLTFYNGTLSLPQMEPGTIPTPFEMIPYAIEIARCGAYARVVSLASAGYNTANQNEIFSIYFPFMRSTPANAGLARGSVPNYGGSILSPPNISIRQDDIEVWVPINSVGGPWFITNYLLLLSADL